MTTSILGINFTTLTEGEVLKKAISFLQGESAKVIFTPNPEMVMKARKDKEFLKILNKGDIVIPDGIGVVFASKLNRVKIKDRVAGYDLVMSILEDIKGKEYSVYILGGDEETSKKAKENIEKNYNIKVVGHNNGYFKLSDEKKILREIKNKKPDIVLVGLGMVKQEKWIYNNKDNLNSKLFLGVGGTIDVLGGKTKRAPEIFIKLNMEWFYRLAKNPERVMRMAVLPLFVLHVVWEKVKLLK